MTFTDNGKSQAIGQAELSFEARNLGDPLCVQVLPESHNMNVSAVLDAVLATAKTSPEFADVAVFILAFGESLAFASLVFPATFVLAAMGALIGSGHLSFLPIWLFAFVGAALGDWLSFWLGRRYCDAIWRLSNRARAGRRIQFRNSLMSTTIPKVKIVISKTSSNALTRKLPRRRLPAASIDHRHLADRLRIDAEGREEAPRMVLDRLYPG